MCVCVCVCVCISVCVLCNRTLPLVEYTNVLSSVYNLYVCVCKCVCVCENSVGKKTLEEGMVFGQMI